MCTHDSSVSGDEYIKILHNIKLFLADIMPGGVFVGMHYIEISLRQKKYCHNCITDITWYIEQYIYNTICCHNNDENVKKDKHSIVEK